MVLITDIGSNNQNNSEQTSVQPLAYKYQWHQEGCCLRHRSSQQLLSFAHIRKMDGKPLDTFVQKPEAGTNIKPFASSLELLACLATVGENAQKEYEHEPTPTILSGNDQIRQLTNKLKGLVDQAVAELKQKSQEQIRTADAQTPKPYSFPEDNGVSKNKKNKAMLIGEMRTSFKLSADFSVHDLDLDKLPVPVHLSERFKPEVKCEKRFTFSERLEDWKLERKLRSKGTTCDSYFIHKKSKELVRSVVEVVNYILYEIRPRDLKKATKGTPKRDKFSESKSLKRTSNNDSSESKSLKRIRVYQTFANGENLDIEVLKMYSEFGFTEAYVRTIMDFLKGAYENLLNSSAEEKSPKRCKRNNKPKQDTKPSFDLKEAINFLARQLDLILYSFFKKVNMLDMYLASKRNVKVDDAGLLSNSTEAAVDDSVTKEFDSLLCRFFKEANMLDIYLASKGMRTDEDAGTSSDSREVSVGDSLERRQIDEILYRFFKEAKLLDLYTTASQKRRAEDTRPPSDQFNETPGDDSLFEEFDDILYRFVQKANLLVVYTGNKRMKAEEPEENDKNVAPPPNFDPSPILEVLPSSPNHVAAANQGESSTVASTPGTVPAVNFLVEEYNNIMLPFPESVPVTNYPGEGQYNPSLISEEVEQGVASSSSNHVAAAISAEHGESCTAASTLDTVPVVNMIVEEQILPVPDPGEGKYNCVGAVDTTDPFTDMFDQLDQFESLPEIFKNVAEEEDPAKRLVSLSKC